MQPSPGRSLTDIFYATQSGQVNPERDHVLIGKERHDIGRPHDWGYPIRGHRQRRHALLAQFRNVSAGPPATRKRGYLNCDGSPTKTEILVMRRQGTSPKFWQLAFGKRGQEELFNIGIDPECMTNLSDNSEYQSVKTLLRDQLFQELKRQDDPRMSGQGAVFDNFPYADARQAHFYERYMDGEKLNAGWVSPTDFEKAPVDE